MERWRVTQVVKGGAFTAGNCSAKVTWLSASSTFPAGDKVLNNGGEDAGG